MIATSTSGDGTGTVAGHRDPICLDVVIVNWNSGSFLRDCLAALDHSTIAGRLNVVVIDNASIDQSSGGLSLDWAVLRLVSNSANIGFGRACNQGAGAGHAPYVLFLNPDVLVASDTIQKSIDYLDDVEHRDVGALGVQLLDPVGRVQRTCARTPSLPGLLLRSLFLDRLWPRLVPPHFVTEWDHTDTRSVDQVMGAFLMIRRSLFEQLGRFDERYFLYYEDVDLCLSVRQAGWKVVYLAGAAAHHSGGGSSNAVKARRLSDLALSRVQYTGKWHGWISAVVLTIFTLGFEMPIRWLHAILTRSPQGGWQVIQAAALFCLSLGGASAGRGPRR